MDPCGEALAKQGPLFDIKFLCDLSVLCGKRKVCGCRLDLTDIRHHADFPEAWRWR